MLLFSLAQLALLAATATACPPLDRHGNVQNLRKRASPDQIPNPNWAYDESADWHTLDPGYEVCQTGTQQSPISLRLDQGLSQNHALHFNYPPNVTGSFNNWGYGPAFSLVSTLANFTGDYTTLPSITFAEIGGQNETVYLDSWHIHAPADHSVQGDRSKAEIHYVHVNATGSPRAVVGMRIDPGNVESAFFNQLPDYIPYDDDSTEVRTVVDVRKALEEVLHFGEFWTYQGSLTSPPCTEGLRWFLARSVLFVGDRQMREILGVSTFSARAEQEVWGHNVNV
ncbi:carbonic anhydrase [Teratosphaeria nubilosa]|uniref:Carbonic anhydrase n=1 Tax=Teratosphaeria nubilosa TaxID=161662 RepID=A0A6G1L2L4_9PEZI|nr:carbonic anhydrase [Teratosphaeria nubilosa]